MRVLVGMCESQNAHITPELLTERRFMASVKDLDSTVATIIIKNRIEQCSPLTGFSPVLRI